jgi:chromosomal replication initiation ATPase DnaA
MQRQLAFDLGGQATYARGDFFASPTNAPALAKLDEWQAWSQGKLLLFGPKGAGKTHLAHVWAQDSGAILISGAEVSEPGLAEAVLTGQSLVVDDADRVAGDPAAETSLFHLHNIVLAGSGRLMLTARAPVRDWGLVLPDLASRIGAADVARLDAPDDALLSAVLVKLFADRQIAVTPPLIAYLVARMERSVAGAADLVVRLDDAALASQRPVTRALAAELLDSAEPQ